MGSIKTKELSKIGYTNDQARSLVINIISRHFKHHSKPEIMQLLTNIKEDPAKYRADEVLGKIADTFMDEPVACNFQSYELLEKQDS